MILTMIRRWLPLVFVLVAAACDADRARPSELDVVAAFSPLAEAAAAIGGDRVEVHDLTPAGSEPHDLELTSRQVDRILDADVVLYVGNGFQPSVEEAVRQRGDGDDRRPTVDVLSTVPADQLRRDDPHVWLAPRLFEAAVNGIRDALGDADPENAVAYTERAEAYQQRLRTLDGELRAGLADCERNVVVTAHEAFGYLAGSYGLEQKAISGLSPESEPEADRIDLLAEEIERTGATTVFTERLASTKTAQALAREAGVEVAVLDPIEGLTEEQRRAGATYFTVMRENLRTLRGALGCR
jgi:zinc transport system substrate-binding protein